MAYMEMQIRKLPYGIQKKLADQLDMIAPRDWKALISVMPSKLYSPEQVKKVHFTPAFHFQSYSTKMVAIDRLVEFHVGLLTVLTTPPILTQIILFHCLVEKKPVFLFLKKKSSLLASRLACLVQVPTQLLLTLLFFTRNLLIKLDTESTFHCLHLH